jgi:hypothetical protein
MNEDVIVPIIVVPAIFFSIVAIFKVVSDNAVRKALVEKGLVDENIRYLFKVTDQTSSLKWGIVLIALGAAIFVAQQLNLSEESLFGMMFLFAGIGLIIYYFSGTKKQTDQLPKS